MRAFPDARRPLEYSQGVEPENVIRSFLKADDPRFRSALDRVRRDEEYRALAVTAFSVTHAHDDAGHVETFIRRYPEQAKGISAAQVHKYHGIYAANVVASPAAFGETAERLPLSTNEVVDLASAVDLVYASQVNRLDGLIGALLDVLDDAGVADDRLIAFTADPGATLPPLRRPRFTRAGTTTLGTRPGDLVEELLVVANVVGRIVVLRSQHQEHRIR